MTKDIEIVLKWIKKPWLRDYEWELDHLPFTLRAQLHNSVSREMKRKVREREDALVGVGLLDH